ncbi:MAG: NAD-dependent epimerase/dehydratase family protein [Actinomycetota bacterium]|nr:NAD-dependent epimerase/dehydratase family protein [Actinomycetota bacterium]
MTVLVVGGNGFLGSHIVDGLLAAGHRVRVLSPNPELFRAPNVEVDYHFGRLDIGVDLEAALDGCEVVVDAASSAVPASADRSPATAIATSVGASTWLGEVCRRSGIRALVYLSSGGTVYGRSGDEVPHRETDALAPIGTYGALKAASELSLAALLRNSDVRHVCLRIANAYGERQNSARPQGIVGVALTRMLQGLPMTLYGDTMRDLIHGSDVASAVVLSVNDELDGVYNVGSGVGIAMSGLLARLEVITGHRIVIEHRPVRSFDVPYSVLDIARVGQAGWSPKVDLDDGLARTWEWLRALGGERER